jgi:hypothetical protein
LALLGARPLSGWEVRVAQRRAAGRNAVPSQQSPHVSERSARQRAHILLGAAWAASRQAETAVQIGGTARALTMVSDTLRDR